MLSTYCFMNRVRGALAATVIGVGVATFVHCGSLDAATMSGSAGDGGTDGAVGPPDGGGDSAAGDASAAPSVLLTVHASPDLFDFRVCFGASPSPDGASVTFHPSATPWPSDDAHPMASSNYAGIAVGGGATLPRALEVSGPYVIPYLIDAHTLAMSSDPKAACHDRVGSGCIPNSGVCLKTTDYVQLPGISAALLAGGGAKLVAIVGCKTPGSAACGTAMGGALHADVLTLASEAVQSVDNIGVQVAHVAAALGPIVMRVDSAGDAGVSVDASYLQVTPPNGFIVTRPGNDTSLGWGTQSVSLQSNGDAGIALKMPLADIQRLSDPSTLPAEFFKQQGTFVFVLVGDTSAANALYIDSGLNPKFDGTGLHFVAISTAPPPALDGG